MSYEFDETSIDLENIVELRSLLGRHKPKKILIFKYGAASDLIMGGGVEGLKR
jgi:hypothetical protein